MARVELMQRLAEEPNLRIRDLADRHRLATNTVSNLIQHMVEDGLATRNPDAADRRAVTVALTPAGDAALAGWLAANERQIQTALDALSVTDRRRIVAAVPALARLVYQLERTDASEAAGAR